LVLTSWLPVVAGCCGVVAACAAIAAASGSTLGVGSLAGAVALAGAGCGLGRGVSALAVVDWNPGTKTFAGPAALWAAAAAASMAASSVWPPVVAASVLVSAGFASAVAPPLAGGTPNALASAAATWSTREPKPPPVVGVPVEVVDCALADPLAVGWAAGLVLRETNVTMFSPLNEAVIRHSLCKASAKSAFDDENRAITRSY
jgi:hypothetical protein